MRLAKMLRLISFIMVASVLALAIGSSFSTSSADNSTDSTTTNITRSDENGLTFSLNLPAAIVDADGVVTVAGLDARFSKPGTPDLPYYSTLIALPPEADASVTIDIQADTAQSVKRIRPIPTSNIEEADDVLTITNLEALGVEYEADPMIYESDSVFPTAQYELSEPMYMRDLRVARLTVYPVRYNPAAQSLTSANELTINVDFSGVARGSNNLLPGNSEINGVLNWEQAAAWRSLPSDFNGRASSFPIGKQTFKIVVDADGVYELTYANLQSAGMNMSSVNPNTLEMMHKGNPVAYEFVGNGNNTFESDEKIRFYGWAFDDSRHDRHYVGENNIFWLWANGSPTHISTKPNVSSGTLVSDWRSTINFEEDKLFITGATTNSGSEEFKWKNSPNEPDAWHWFGLRNDYDNATQPVTKTVPIDLPDPTASSNADILVEFTNTNAYQGHTVDIWWNDALVDTEVWNGNVNINSTHTNISNVNTTNNIELYSRYTLNGNLASDDVLVNRITVTYDRELKTVNDHLQFEYAANGAHRFPVSNFSDAGVNNGVVAWDISDRLLPEAIVISPSDITDNGGSNTVTVGVSNATAGKYLVSADFTTVPAANISTYTATSLEPSGSSAEWVAIAHADFVAETNTLATHRAATSGLSTHVVDVADVYNQYGYGFAVPSAIIDFLTHGLTWGLEYATLVGDSTQNPRKLPCIVEDTLAYTTCNATWTTTDNDYVVTDFQFKDRFIGMTASDHTFATIVGSDELEDIAVGRLAVTNVAEMQAFNEKIVLYENGLKTGAAFTRNIVWLADDADQGGDFCTNNQQVRNTFFGSNPYEDNIQSKEICLKDFFPPEVPPDDATNSTPAPPIAKENARIEFFNYMTAESARIVNYRGHGSANDWAADFVNAGHSAQWENTNKPTVILSADCLDGNFYKSGEEALGETFMQIDLKRGTVGHWSSSGLGYTTEHTVLHKGFYNGLYTQNHNTLGDAIQYSKNNYVGQGESLSEVYSFILLGDPAMRMLPFSDTDGKPFKIFVPMLAK